MNYESIIGGAMLLLKHPITQSHGMEKKPMVVSHLQEHIFIILKLKSANDQSC